MNLAGARVGPDSPLFLIAGPCVIESLQFALETAGQLAEITRELQIPFVYKSSYDKANRTSSASFRGPGAAEGLDILDQVRHQVGVPVLTDVHTPDEARIAAEVVDVAEVVDAVVRLAVVAGRAVAAAA